ncbi:MAG: hypothetical protein ACYC4R_06630 [Anaerolineae bacterium]
MNQMVMLVLDQVDRLDDVIEAWYQAGVGGITIMESTGGYRRRSYRRMARRFPFDFGHPDTLQGHYTVFAIVDGPDVVERCLIAAEQVVGDLALPNTGVFASWPLARVKGTVKVPSVGGKTG